MKKIGFLPVLTQTSSFFALCLLGGATLNMAYAEKSLTHRTEAKVAQVNKNVGTQQEQAISNAVAEMMQDSQANVQYVAEPFLKNAYYQQDDVISRLTRLEIERQISEQVTLAMNEKAREMTESLSNHQESKLEDLIRQEVVRALNASNDMVQKDKLGWVYLGRFEDNRWLGSPLKIGGKLPEKGQQYVTNGDVNIRKSFSALQPVTYVLQANTSVKLMDVVKRGDKGHYWAKVNVL